MSKLYLYTLPLLFLLACGSENTTEGTTTETEPASEVSEQAAEPAAEKEQLDVCTLLTAEMAQAFMGCNTEVSGGSIRNSCKYGCTDPFGGLTLSVSEASSANYGDIKARRDENPVMEAVEVSGAVFAHFAQAQESLNFYTDTHSFSLQAIGRGKEEVIALAEEILGKL
ncbi:MAG: hypothetical protein AAGF87_16030 [Bacteroidota bacterium]